jgi:hypothetical protein
LNYRHDGRKDPSATCGLLPVLLLDLVAVSFAGGLFGVFNLAGSPKPNPTKLGAYESGNETLADVPAPRFRVGSGSVSKLVPVVDAEAVTEGDARVGVCPK